MMSETSARNDLLLKPTRPVGIVGYGAYVPRYRLPATEVARVWAGGEGGLPIKEKAVPGLDEDVITMSIEAARNALQPRQDRSRRLARRVGRLRIAPLCGQTHLHRGGGGHRRDPPHPGSRLGIRLQSRHRSDGGGDGLCRLGHGATTPWRSGWTLPRASPATRWNTPPAPAARPLSWARRRSRWR